jgi:hypothetical protein
VSAVNASLSVAMESRVSGGLQLEVDSRDGHLNRPAQVNYTDPPALFWQAMWSSLRDPPVRPEPWGKLLELKEPGQAHLRLYCPPSASYKLYLSEPPAFTEAVPEVVWTESQPSRSQFAASAPPYVIRIPGRDARSYPPVEDVGTRYASEFEVLAFNFSREGQLKRPWASGVELLYSSQFINRAGAPAAMPRPHPKDPTVFEAAEEVAGSLIVRYNTHYRLLRCHYGLPSGPLLDELRWAWIRGDISQVEMPPLMAFAMGPQHAAQVRLERRVWPSGIVWSFFTSQAADAEPDAERVLSETGRVSSTEKVYSPTDPDVYVEVERARELTLQDSQGRIWRLRLAGKA